MKKSVFDLPHELPNRLRLHILGHHEILGNFPF